MRRCYGETHASLLAPSCVVFLPLLPAVSRLYVVLRQFIAASTQTNQPAAEYQGSSTSPQCRAAFPPPSPCLVGTIARRRRRRSQSRIQRHSQWHQRRTSPWARCSPTMRRSCWTPNSMSGTRCSLQTRRRRRSGAPRSSSKVTHIRRNRRVILASFNLQLYRRIREQVLKDTNDTNFEHVL
jgi:hypothetical protein